MEVAFLAVVSLVVLSIGVGSNIFAQAPSNLQSTIVPPANTGVLRDPSGTYVFYNITNTQNANNTTTMRYSMNLTSYEMLLHDPYSGFAHEYVQTVGNMVEISSTYSTITVNPGGPAIQASNSTLP
jgi:hypothetical protein